MSLRSDLDSQVRRGVASDPTDYAALVSMSGAEAWLTLAQGLMSKVPSNVMLTLYETNILSMVLPEVGALFGVPGLSSEQTEVDLGQHIMNSLDEAAACSAPLEVRFAILVMHVGKFDSPPEHLPVHYRHMERAAPRIEAISRRFSVPESCRELALLALYEVERVHRVSEVRAGPVAAMLERLGAFESPERFERLLTVCACDYRAHGRRSGQVYPKAELLNLARSACLGVSWDGDVQMARAQAIARTFGSERWS